MNVRREVGISNYSKCFIFAYLTVFTRNGWNSDDGSQSRRTVSVPYTQVRVSRQSSFSPDNYFYFMLGLLRHVQLTAGFYTVWTATQQFLLFFSSCQKINWVMAMVAANFTTNNKFFPPPPKKKGSSHFMATLEKILWRIIHKFPIKEIDLLSKFEMWQDMRWFDKGLR